MVEEEKKSRGRRGYSERWRTALRRQGLNTRGYIMPGSSLYGAVHSNCLGEDEGTVGRHTLQDT